MLKQNENIIPWPDMRSIQHLVLTKSWLGKIWEKLPSHISCHLMLSHAVSCRLNTYRAQDFPTCMTGRQSASSIHARCNPSTYPSCKQTRSESSETISPEPEDSIKERHPDKESATLSKITIEWLCRSFQVWANDDTLKALSSTQTGLAVRNSSITTCLSSVSRI